MVKPESQLWDKIILIAYCLLFFLTPLIVSPLSFELFEFGKMIWVYLITILIAWAWVMKMLDQKKIIFVSSFWDRPLLIFLLSQVLATVVSIDQHTSIFGYYSRFNGGLLSTICYLVLYWAAVSNLDKGQLKTIVKTILASSLLVAGYGIAEHFGIDKHLWVQDVQNRVFSTLGQPNWLAAYLDVLILLFLTKSYFGKSNEKKIYLLLSGVFTLCLFYTKSRSGWIGLAIPLFLPILWLLKTKFPKFVVGGFGLILLLGLILSPKTLRWFQSQYQAQPTVVNGQTLLITPSTDIRKIVWKGARDLWKQWPIFGTGVETFAYSYYWTRPIEHNLTSEWDFLYNKAHNEYLNLAATTGTVGLVSSLLLIISCLVWMVKNSKNGPLSVACFLVMVSIAVTNFFGFSVVPVAVMFFLLPALAFIEQKPDQNNESQTPTGKNTFAKLLISLLAIVGLVATTGYYLADIYFVQASNYQKINSLDLASQKINQAIKLNPLEPNFYSQKALITSKQVAILSQTQNPEEKQVDLLAQQAETSIQKALKISPYQINFYKNQVKVYYYLSFYNLDYLTKGLEALLTAEQLAPTDPKIPYNTALIYQTLKQADLAEEYFQKALALKPNYQEAQAGLEELETASH
ncbi:MAG: O-antigen ligase family protein [Patescibacteria group bacterium]